MNPPIELYTDGSCIKNPGRGGIAYIVRYYETLDPNGMPQVQQYQNNQGYKYTTNNRMEILACINGIKDIMFNISNGRIKDTNAINLFSDSKYFCDAINQKWVNKWSTNNWMTSGFQGSQPKPVKNKDLWEQMIEIQKQLMSMNLQLNITHIPGHQGHEFNETCDKLAKDASTNDNCIPDEVYENNNGNKFQNNYNRQNQYGGR